MRAALCLQGLSNNFNNTGFLDYWFISNSMNMNKFGDLYHKIDEYLSSGTVLSNHTLSKHHIKSLGSEDNTSYAMFSPKDFDLIRMLLIRGEI